MAKTIEKIWKNWPGGGKNVAKSEKKWPKVKKIAKKWFFRQTENVTKNDFFAIFLHFLAIFWLKSEKNRPTEKKIAKKIIFGKIFCLAKKSFFGHFFLCWAIFFFFHFWAAQSQKK